ncbi:aldehyde dehydrogenase family protein [Paenibacillus sp. NFR01]|uniref:aldehyde dehydrogenase family protein n=1 Tax=Paenibacillus sp. NFR01 TaxID=1566279 RepID=UPI0008D0D275|nr:aldehyde dehydrogenase family protein [Paenibacillus sp. NFR01]SET12124.1 aldehyde dehydrogenase (NAD+) [Paenibacillus sp. NFR01]
MNEQELRVINRMYVNGEFVRPQGTEEMELINPANRKVIGKVTLGNEADALAAVAAAKTAFTAFSQTTVEERMDMLLRLREGIEAKADQFTSNCIEEYGATLRVAQARSKLTADFFGMAYDLLQNFAFRETIGRAEVVKEPLGVVAVITPWNANTSQITAKISSAIAAGCTMVIKPSEISAIQTDLLAQCIHEAGIPAGVVNFVNGLGSTVGSALLRHPDVAMISFTGSTKVGQMIYREAAVTMKKVVLELGGKSPNLVLDDADLEQAIPRAIMGCFMNNGQACIAGTRLFVPETRIGEVKAIVRRTLEGLKTGNPWDEDTVIGPLAGAKQYEQVQRYIRLGLEEGAELIGGGEGHPEGLEGGYYVKPTVFAGVKPEMTIAREEIFGPVLSILTYGSEEEAVAMANDTDFGLGAYIQSGDPERAMKVASQIAAGVVVINDAGFEMTAPFGGYKHSGIGRENGVYGVEEFLQVKSIMR